MRRYRYSYQTIVSYNTDVTHHNFLLRCTPCDTARQRVTSQHLHLLAESDYTRTVDNFGNTIHYGALNTPHDLFVVASSGTVECDGYCFAESTPAPYYLAATHMTTADARLAEFGAKVSCDGNPLTQALALAYAIYTYMSYKPGVTDTSTTASESFATGEGVCQDYAHQLIALCRDRGIMARYVVGFLVGTGETHAWVEVYSEGSWYGVDPTHYVLIEYEYIKIAQGRDAADCSVTRGVQRGVSHHTTEIRVVVTEI